MVEEGDITLFKQMFDVVPKSIVAADMGKQNIRFSDLINHVERFRLQELFMLAKFFDLKEETMFQLAYNQYLAQKSKKK